MMRATISSAIFSRLRPAVAYHAQNSIQSVSRIEKLHDDAGNGNLPESREQLAEVDGVFFGGDETASVILLA
jgi:hypothetical protein